MTRRRLDAELARRGLARSREHAQGLIASGVVRVKGQVAVKSATWVEAADAIDVQAVGTQVVSRGAHKLMGALDAWPGVVVAGRDALDAGASTGGFTQVLLERGARQVIAVDVGYGQLAWTLRQDPRVVVMDRTNVRHLTATDLPFAPDLIVADLSFISLTTVLPALVGCAAQGADLILMVKPQFEVGREAVGHGVVSDPALRAGAITKVAHEALGLGLSVHGVVASPLPGPSGNVEYFLWLAKGSGQTAGDPMSKGSDRPEDLRQGGALDSAIAAAVREGPA